VKPVTSSNWTAVRSLRYGPLSRRKHDANSRPYSRIGGNSSLDRRAIGLRGDGQTCLRRRHRHGGPAAAATRSDRRRTCAGLFVDRWLLGLGRWQACLASGSLGARPARLSLGAAPLGGGSRRWLAAGRGPLGTPLASPDTARARRRSCPRPRSCPTIAARSAAADDAISLPSQLGAIGGRRAHILRRNC
jgi:hypothetical protein